MRAFSSIVWQTLAGTFCLLAGVAGAQDVVISETPPLEVLISVADQKLVVLRDGGLVGKYKISTSRFGIGDSYGSYKTPLGKLRVCDKIGDELAPGAVIKNRSATGEVIPVNAPGRDPIVTRVIWLEGLEERNANAHARGIYIHGTPEETNLGKPASWGCIRMRSEDVIEIFNEVPVGTPVNIVADHLPKLHKYKAPPPAPVLPPEPLIAENTAVPAAPKQTVHVQEKTGPQPVAEHIVAADVSREKIHIVPATAETVHVMKGSILFANMPQAAKPAPQTASTTTTTADVGQLSGNAISPPVKTAQ